MTSVQNHCWLMIIHYYYIMGVILPNVLGCTRDLYNLLQKSLLICRKTCSTFCLQGKLIGFQFPFIYTQKIPCFPATFGDITKQNLALQDFEELLKQDPEFATVLQGRRRPSRMILARCTARHTRDFTIRT